MSSNKDEDADVELLPQLKMFNEIQKQRSFKHRLCRLWKSLKSALGQSARHVGLMISLSVYCVVGGVVCTFLIYNFVALIRNIWKNGFLATITV